MDNINTNLENNIEKVKEPKYPKSKRQLDHLAKAREIKKAMQTLKKEEKKKEPKNNVEKIKQEIMPEPKNNIDNEKLFKLNDDMEFIKKYIIEKEKRKEEKKKLKNVVEQDYYEENYDNYKRPMVDLFRN